MTSPGAQDATAAVPAAVSKVPTRVFKRRSFAPPFKSARSSPPSNLVAASAARQNAKPMSVARDGRDAVSKETATAATTTTVAITTTKTTTTTAIPRSTTALTSVSVSTAAATPNADNNNLNACKRRIFAPPSRASSAATPSTPHDSRPKASESPSIITTTTATATTLHNSIPPSTTASHPRNSTTILAQQCNKRKTCIKEIPSTNSDATQNVLSTTATRQLVVNSEQPRIKNFSSNCVKNSITYNSNTSSKCKAITNTNYAVLQKTVSTATATQSALTTPYLRQSTPNAAQPMINHLHNNVNNNVDNNYNNNSKATVNKNENACRSEFTATPAIQSQHLTAKSAQPGHVYNNNTTDKSVNYNNDSDSNNNNQTINNNNNRGSQAMKGANSILHQNLLSQTTIAQSRQFTSISAQPGQVYNNNNTNNNNNMKHQCSSSSSAITSTHPNTSTSPYFKWEFPFEPYGIQVDFMQCLYNTLDEGHCAILESPTGTGKTLSIICSALHWLQQNPSLSRNEAKSTIMTTTATDARTDKSSNTTGTGTKLPGVAKGEDDDVEPDWMKLSSIEHAKQERDKSGADAVREKVKNRVEKDMLRKSLSRKRQRKSVHSRYNGSGGGLVTIHEDPLALDDYDSDNGGANKEMDECSSSSSSEEDSDNSDNNDDLDAGAFDGIRRIIYASRTHSQLSQFLGEVKSTSFGREISCVQLGSRQQLCVNPSVASLSSSTKINERCKDLHDLRKKNGKNSGCAWNKKGRLRKLQDYILYEVQDIEEIAELGKSQHACSYYASRGAVESAQLIALPYSMLLHKDTRETLGIDLKGAVVICDEAHNLLDSLADLHSAELSLAQVDAAYTQLQTYRVRYKSKLKAKNKIYVSQLIAVVVGIRSYLAKASGRTTDTADTKSNRNESVDSNSSGGNGFVGSGGGLKAMSKDVVDFTFAANIDHINLFKLVKYMQVSRIAVKVQGLADSQWQKQQQQQRVSGTKTTGTKTGTKTEGIGSRHDQTVYRFPVRAIATFIASLLNLNGDGTILTNAKLPDPTVKFVMLNPGVHFNSLVESCRSVVLAGGTMHPIDSYVSQLFASVPTNNVRTFSCGHVIPDQNLISICLAKGPSGLPLDMTYKARGTTQMMDQVGQTLANLCNVVPQGMVVFVPSYSYEEQLVARWTETGLLNRIGKRKVVIREPRGAGKLDSILELYAKACEGGDASTGGCITTGGLLLSVVGGKLSEGINFSNGLARCVVVLGMPYPHPHDPEIVSRMSFLDRTQNATQKGVGCGVGAGSDFYENQCMKAVNQCVGRAIRHKDDYAAVVLMDQRYQRKQVVGRLPKWISKRYQNPPSFGLAYRALRQFFKAKEE